jgi:thymidine kinase
MVVRVDENGYALREGSQVEIGGNDRYVSVCRREFKDVYFGGQAVRLIDPLQNRAEDESSDQEPLLK